MNHHKWDYETERRIAASGYEDGCGRNLKGCIVCKILAALNPTPENEAFSNHPARQDATCLGCGGPKVIGCIVCWTCFKRRTDGKSLKWFDGTFSQWLAAIGRAQ